MRLRGLFGVLPDVNMSDDDDDDDEYSADRQTPRFSRDREQSMHSEKSHIAMEAYPCETGAPASMKEGRRPLLATAAELHSHEVLYCHDVAGQAQYHAVETRFVIDAWLDLGAMES
ncbi:hypothetical protein BV20DRAFT_966249 [Pilatotrama ljubarskyi]|nr:hypothetical protein BV20DRAFT_966249 [Pilatotrama ljubarskyi]